MFMFCDERTTDFVGRLEWRIRIENWKILQQWITAHIGDNHSFEWGEIEALYDRKGGRTAIWLSYKRWNIQTN